MHTIVNVKWETSKLIHLQIYKGEGKPHKATKTNKDHLGGKQKCLIVSVQGSFGGANYIIIICCRIMTKESENASLGNF